jgi:sulfur carrier protein ThiS
VQKLAFAYFDMKVKLEFVALLNIENMKSGDWIELEAPSTITDLLTKIGISDRHQKFVIPFINQKPARRSSSLEDGDEVYLFLPVGGG